MASHPAPERTLVIGAGPSGLVALKTLRAAGVDAVAYETSPFLGGQWVIDNPNGASSAYDSLETNTTRKMSRLSDFEFPPGDREFISGAELLDWWEAYADRFDLHEHIRFETKVVTMTPLPGVEAGGWKVEAEPPEAGEEFSAVVIATGNYWDPRNLDLPGEFTGERLHAKYYRNPKRPIDTGGKTVVVIGTGSTGCEIAAELSASATEAVWLSARSGAHIGPKLVNGAPTMAGVPYLHPLDELPSHLELLPERVRRRLFHLSSGRRSAKARRKSSFSYAAVGLPEPPHPLAKRTSSSQGIFPQFASGKLNGCGEIVELYSGGVILADGSRKPADVVIEATGYHVTFPFLDPAHLNTTGDDMTLYRRIMHPDRSDLFVVGIARPLGSFWAMAEVQAMWIADHLSGRSSFPGSKDRAKHQELVMGTAMLPAYYGQELRDDARRRRL